MSGPHDSPSILVYPRPASSTGQTIWASIAAVALFAFASYGLRFPPVAGLALVVVPLTIAAVLQSRRARSENRQFQHWAGQVGVARALGPLRAAWHGDWVDSYAGGDLARVAAGRVILFPLDARRAPLLPGPGDAPGEPFEPLPFADISRFAELRDWPDPRARQARPNLPAIGGLLVLIVAAGLLLGWTSGATAVISFLLAIVLVHPLWKRAAGRRAWWFAPGALVETRGAYPARVYEARRAVLVARADDADRWRLLVANSRHTGHVQVTTSELHVLLRCWLSPVTIPVHKFFEAPD